MSKTVVGLFDDANSKRVERELENAGYARADIRRRTRLLGGSIAELERLGIPNADARAFEAAMARGQTLVTVETYDRDVDKAAAIMQRYEIGATTAGGARRVAETDEVVIPVVEEELEVGKREVGRGGIHVFTRIREESVDEDIRLRDEHVHVERRAVDRIATESDIAAAQSTRDIVMRERGEEAVVAKRAHVVEEVHIGKDVEEHIEHIHDTIKKTEVEIEPLDAKGRGLGYDTALRDLRGHFDKTFSGKNNATWESYEPAYRLGHRMAGDRRYGGREWSTIERDARARWESDYPGTWERVKEAVRHAFDRARGGMARHA